MPVTKKKRIRQPRALTDEQLEELGYKRVYDEEGCVHIETINTLSRLEIASKILDIRQKAMNDVNASTESDWVPILGYALDDIEALCKQTLGEK